MKTFSIALLAITACATVSRSEVHFRNLSFADAKAASAKEHKPIMIDFYTTWCGWCKTLDHNTYTDENVAKFANDKFIPVKIDAEKGEGVALAKEYHVSGYPTIVFLDKSGKEIQRIGGYQPPAQFLRSMQSAAAGGTKALIDEIEGPHPPKDATKWMTAAYYYAESDQRDKALDAFKKVLEFDPENKEGSNAEAMYGVGFLSTGNDQWDVLADALQKFPNEVDADQANMMLLRHEIDTHDTAKAGHRIDAWAMAHPRDGATFNFFAWTAAQHNTLLAAADDYSKRSVELATSPKEKAASLDTRAGVLFTLGKISDAANLESDAIKLVDPQKDKKLFNEISTQKAKFEKILAEAK